MTTSPDHPEHFCSSRNSPTITTRRRLGNFFVGLKRKVEGDRALLEDLLGKIGHVPSTFAQNGRWFRGPHPRPLNDGGEGGARQTRPVRDTGMLALGVQGKRLLWLALGEFWRAQAAIDILAD